MNEQMMMEQLMQMGLSPEQIQQMSPEEMVQMLQQQNMGQGQMMGGQEGGPQQDFDRFAKMQRLGNASGMMR